MRLGSQGVVKGAKNFINVSKTCALRHELSQVCHRYYGLFPTNKFKIPPGALSLGECELNEEGSLLIKITSEKFDKNSLILEEVKVHGTSYVMGNVVVLKKENAGELEVGLIQIMVHSENKLHFLVKTHIARQNKFNLYISQSSQSERLWVQLEDLLDYYPLTCLGSSGSFRFVLPHFISEK